MTGCNHIDPHGLLLFTHPSQGLEKPTIGNSSSIPAELRNIK